MYKRCFLLFAAFLLIGCAGTAAPDVRGNVFDAAGTEPCVRVTFPDTVAYKSMQRMDYGGESVIRYNVELRNKPFYEIALVKIYNADADAEWALVPISAQYLPEEKIYEITDHEIFFERSAMVILFEAGGGEVYLRGLVGEYAGSDKAVMVTIDRLVQNAEYSHLFSPGGWRNSGMGKIFIEDMKRMVDWFFVNMEQTSCLPDSSLRGTLSK